MIVADTDVLMDYLRGAGAADRVALELGVGQLATTGVSSFELTAGAHGGRQQSAVGVLLAALEVLPLTPSSAERAANIHRELQERGAGIGMADSLIAGSAWTDARCC